MSKSTTIPVWEMNEMTYRHFGIAHKPPSFASFQIFFHINRIEEYRDKIQFPLPPHRKQVYDFLFITKGKTQRSKALNEYEIGENTFFFLPAYQITTHEYVSPDIEGYYVHFNIEIFNNYLPQHNILRDFPFLQYIGKPTVEIDNFIKPYLLNILHRLEAEYGKRKEKDVDFKIITAYLFTLFTEINNFYNPV